MTRAITQNEFLATTPQVLSSIGEDTLVIEDGKGRVVAALISPAEYETIRKAKAQQAIDAMRAFGEHMQRVTTPEELDALEKELHQLAR